MHESILICRELRQVKQATHDDRFLVDSSSFAVPVRTAAVKASLSQRLSPRGHIARRVEPNGGDVEDEVRAGLLDGGTRPVARGPAERVLGLQEVHRRAV